MYPMEASIEQIEASIEQARAIHELTRELTIERNLTQEYEDIIAAERRDRARLRIELEEAYNREKELRKKIANFEAIEKRIDELILERDTLKENCRQLSISLAYERKASTKIKKTELNPETSVRTVYGKPKHEVKDE